MSLDDFDPMKAGGAVGLFGAVAAFLFWMLTKAKALFKNGDAEEIKGMLRDQNETTRESFIKVFDRLDNLGQRVSKVEGVQEASWDHTQPDRRGEPRPLAWKQGREPR